MYSSVNIYVKAITTFNSCSSYINNYLAKCSNHAVHRRRKQGGEGGKGRFQKINKGSSFVGVASTPLKHLPSCYHVKWRGDWI